MEQRLSPESDTGSEASLNAYSLPKTEIIFFGTILDTTLDKVTTALCDTDDDTRVAAIRATLGITGDLDSTDGVLAQKLHGVAQVLSERESDGRLDALRMMVRRQLTIGSAITTLAAAASRLTTGHDAIRAGPDDSQQQPGAYGLTPGNERVRATPHATMGAEPKTGDGLAAINKVCNRLGADGGIANERTSSTDPSSDRHDGQTAETADDSRQRLRRRAAGYLMSGGYVFSLLVRTMEARPDLRASHILNHLRRSLAHALSAPERDTERQDIRRAYDTEVPAPVYPRDYETPGAWEQGLIHILHNPEALERLEEGMLRNVLGSSPFERGAGTMTGIGIMEKAGRLDPHRPLTILDIGSSLMTVMAHIAVGLNYQVNITDVHTGKVDLYDTRDFERTINACRDIGHIVCNDIAPFGDNTDRKKIARAVAWAVSNTFNPTELMDEFKFGRVNALIEALLNNLLGGTITFVQGDLTGPEPPDFGQQQFDFVNISTLLYMLSPEQRKIILQLAIKLAKVAVIMQDHIILKDGNTPWDQLEVPASWKGKYPYRTYALFPDDDGNWQDDDGNWVKWQSVAEWTDSRCRIARYGDGVIRTSKMIKTKTGLYIPPGSHVPIKYLVSSEAA